MRRAGTEVLVRSAIVSRMPHNLQDHVCSVEGCVDLVRCKGFCAFHYQRHLDGRRLDTPRLIMSRDGVCAVEGCGREIRSRGLCSRHYDKAQRSGVCPSCGGRRGSKSLLCKECHTAVLRVPDPVDRTCTRCGETKPLSEFGLRSARQGSAKWRSRCRACEQADSRERQQSASLPRDRSLPAPRAPYLSLRRYAKQLGIPWSEVVERYPPDNRCELCGRTQQEARPGGRVVRLDLDHDHVTNSLRGFLCGPCNSGLGMLGDTLDRVEAAAAYLRRSV